MFRTYLIWLLAGLWLAPVLSYAQPSWYKKPEKSHPRPEYLIGLGASSAADAVTRQELARENARSDLIKAIRTRVSSEFYGQTTETSKHLDQFAQTRIISSASLEVDGIEVAKQEERGNTAYALAVLSRTNGHFAHSQKLAQLEQEIGQGYAEAQRYEKAGQTEPALRAYLRLYPLLSRREDTQVVLVALGDFAASAFAELDRAEGSDIPTRAQIDAAIERLTTGTFIRLDDAAVALAFRLAAQFPPGQRVLVLPFTYGETRFASPFSRYLAQAVAHKLADSGLQPVQAPSGYEPRSADLEREFGRQAGAQLAVRGPYMLKGAKLKVFALATRIDSARKAGAADVEIDTDLVAQENLDFRPRNFQQALSDAGVFAQGELVPGSLRVEAWTDRGAENLVLEEGEKVTLAVRVNQACYLQMVYHLANGMRALLYNNYYIDAAKVNHAVVLPDSFVVEAPFGVEVLHVFASTEKYPQVRVRNWEGYEVLSEDLGTYVARVRGLKRQEGSREMAETRVTITTMPRR